MPEKENQKIAIRKKMALTKPKVMSITRIEGPECFWVNHGPVVSSLPDLLDAVEHMSDETFKHHIQGGQNDFVVWIDEVLGEHKLAKRLKRLKSRKGFAKALAEALDNAE